MKFSVFLFLLFSFSGFTQQLVMKGDYPDPSVVKIGDTYWATATTSNWMPAFPLLKSKDLINWKHAGNVFNTLPEWADYYFWAPEISYEKGKVYVYYAAHKKNGNLCVGVASADKPEGPYSDHGTLICQDAGSIDAFPMRDENGKLYLVWKEDGNSVKKPTPIWAQEMNEERTALLGEKHLLFSNDAPWEGNLVEGVSMIRKGIYFYAFYAGAGCCGTGCNYTTGVARSKSLLGPWEKYSKNPLLINNSQWKCPGHGTPVERGGRYYFLYHAYDMQSHIYTGREGVLTEFRFTPDGWIEFVQTPANAPARTGFEDKDNFSGKNLDDAWQWSVFQEPAVNVGGGLLTMKAVPVYGTYIGRKTLGADYIATATVHAEKSSATTGLGVIGDDKNRVAILFKGDQLQVIAMRNGASSILAEERLTVKKRIDLRMLVDNGHNIRFEYSTNGKTFIPVNSQPVNGSYLPPWDRALRVGLIAQGEENTVAVFDDLEIRYQPVE